VATVVLALLALITDPGRARIQGLARSGSLIAAGALLLASRAALSGPLAAVGDAGLGAESGSGRRLAIVESVGSPKAAEQIALIPAALGEALDEVQATR